ncbi:hypothetical protein E7681_17080 [Thalassobius vesicularis]|uniref:Uncharacterized protein n=1 Tax=Thalassobius vesicularis TaxID=1294297 RepID=A0A4S3M829_9RHOB|nr:hypothetical protein E7681_17080 [Thalassobius vesicularis]
MFEALAPLDLFKIGEQRKYAGIRGKSLAAELADPTPYGGDRASRAGPPAREQEHEPGEKEGSVAQRPPTPTGWP